MVEVVHAREVWSSKCDFVLSLMGWAVGFGNLWRFPYLCFKNGGGCFLIPYFIFLVVAAVPLNILEVGLGQYLSQGGITAWEICPLVKGIGYASMVVVLWICIYYAVILAWVLFYLFASFQSTLPWSDCNNVWNTPNCVSYTKGRDHDGEKNNTFANVSSLFNLTTVNVSKRISASQEYWDHRVLRLSDGLGEPGAVNWDLALCLLLAWILCFGCIIKGVKISGKVVYFTATAPYVLLTILLIRGLTLPGALTGIKFYITPDRSKLLDGQVWLDAGTQVLYTYGIGMSTLLTLGSFNKYHNNFYKDCIWHAVYNSGSSVVGGFLIFSVLGFMAKNQGVGVQDVVQSGPGLIFIVYPEVVAQIPLAPLWSVLFFFMLILIGLDTAFVNVETVITGIVDMFPHELRRGHRKQLFVILGCCLMFLVGLSMVTEGGIYVFQLFDAFSGSGSVLLLVTFGECVAIGWLYGRERFYDNIESMLGFRINPWCGWCWSYLSPIFCLTVLAFYLVTYHPLKYREYVYPGWGQAIGWLMTLSSLSLIPAVMIYKLMNTTGTIKELFRKLIEPQIQDKKEPHKNTRLIVPSELCWEHFQFASICY